MTITAGNRSPTRFSLTRKIRDYLVSTFNLCINTPSNPPQFFKHKSLSPHSSLLCYSSCCFLLLLLFLIVRHIIIMNSMFSSFDFLCAELLSQSLKSSTPLPPRRLALPRPSSLASSRKRSPRPRKRFLPLDLPWSLMGSTASRHWSTLDDDCSPKF
uniref:Uncharacterized protein n=1 Tax=Kalanchoe fedtschenkoi TaxID=63787 RepID=A0A7N0UKD6_KALFE